MNHQRTGPYFILLVFVIILILNRLLAYTGHFGYDDLHYAELAANLLQGDINFEDHYLYRFPVILFTALFYLIFGMSDLSSSLPALLITSTILVMVFRVLKEHGPKVLFIGLALCTLSNWFLYYSDKLMPDIYVALSVLWALVIIHNYKFKADGKNPALYGFLLALALLFGFMSKGTIILILPLLVFLVLTDFLYKRNLQLWAYSLLSGLALLGLYLLLIWILTGNPLQRFAAISNNAYLNLCSYDQQSAGILLRRVFRGFFELSIYQSLATGFIFILATLFQKKGLQIFRMDNSNAFFRSAAVILLLSSNFMTISLSSYTPMCLDPRHYLFLVPVAAIAAAPIIVAYLENRSASWQILAGLTVLSLVSFFLQGDSFWKLYLPLTGAFLICLFLKSQKLIHYLFMLLFPAILLLIPLEMVTYARQVKYRAQRSILEQEVLDKRQDQRIVSNEVQVRLLKYYSDFREDQAQRFLSYQEYAMEQATGGDPLLLLNGHTRYLSGMQQDDLPPFARHIPPEIKPDFISEDPDIRIYSLKDIPLAHMEYKLLFSSFNDFENGTPFWNQHEKDISETISYEGRRSNAVPEFSSTFDFLLDSLQTDFSHDLLIRCQLFYFAKDQSDVRLVVSLENEQEPIFWKAMEMNRYLRAYSNWWPVLFEIRITSGDLQASSRLKVYAWKNEPAEVYIDNFRIDICEIKPE